MPDRINALIQILKNDPTTNGLVKSRIFADELPDHQVAHMPRACIVVQDASGAPQIGHRSYMDHSDSRADMRFYAWTHSSARTIFTTVQYLLRHMQRTVVGDTLLHWCTQVAGPIPMWEMPPAYASAVGVRRDMRRGGEAQPDKEAHWPFLLATWQVYGADVAIAA